jgi:hypothetical protein
MFLQNVKWLPMDYMAFPEDSILYKHCCESLKSYKLSLFKKHPGEVITVFTYASYIVMGIISTNDSLVH